MFTKIGRLSFRQVCLAGVGTLSLYLAARWFFWDGFTYKNRIQQVDRLLDSLVPKEPVQTPPLPSLDSDPSITNSRGVRILCIDGGGVRGIIASTYLEALETELQATYPGAHLGDYFDLVCGTSTGGLIALAHVQARIPMAQISKLYKAGAVFDTPHGALLSVPKTPVFGARYAGSPTVRYESLLKKIFGEEDLVKKTHTHLFVTAVDGRTYDSLILTNYPDLDRPNRFSYLGKCKTWEAARATSAAPTFFPGLDIQNKSLVDGGLLHNNPILLAIGEAGQIWPGRKIDLIVSVGTGQSPLEETSSFALFDPLRQVFESVANTQEADLLARAIHSSRTKIVRFQLVRPKSVGLDETSHEKLQLLSDMVVKDLRANNKVQKTVKRIIKSKGLSYRDVLLVADTYPNQTRLPFSPDISIEHEERLFKQQDVMTPLNLKKWIDEARYNTALNLSRWSGEHLVIVARGPISISILLGYLLKYHQNVTMFQPFKQQVQRWELSLTERAKAPTPFFQPGETKEIPDFDGKVVIFLTVANRYSFTEADKSRMAAALSLPPDSLAVMSFRTTDAEIIPGAAADAEKDFDNILDQVKRAYPRNTGLVISSTLPQPLNFILGTKLNETIYRSIHLSERLNDNQYFVFKLDDRNASKLP